MNRSQLKEIPKFPLLESYMGQLVLIIAEQSTIKNGISYYEW